MLDETKDRAPPRSEFPDNRVTPRPAVTPQCSQASWACAALAPASPRLRLGGGHHDGNARAQRSRSMVGPVRAFSPCKLYVRTPRAEKRRHVLGSQCWRPPNRIAVAEGGGGFGPIWTSLGYSGRQAPLNRLACARIIPFLGSTTLAVKT